MTSRAQFHYCPACGRAQAGTVARSFRCGNCDYHYFHNTACAAAALIVCNDDLLVTVRAHDPGAGQLDLPGGFIDPRETVEAGLLRELNEELGLTRPPTTPRYLCSQPNTYAYDGILYDVCDLFFVLECRERPQVQAADDVASVSWRALATLTIEAFAMASVRAVLTEFCAARRTC